MKRTAIAPFRLVSPGPAMTAGALRRLSETPGFTAFLDLLPDAVLVLAGDGQLLAANRAAAARLGLAPPPRDGVPATAPGPLGAELRTLAARAASGTCRLPLALPGGGRPVEAIVHVLPAEPGQAALRVVSLAEAAEAPPPEATAAEPGSTPLLYQARLEPIIELGVRAFRARRRILLLGETGVGKSTLVKTMHRQVHGTARPFVHVNCSSISETLFEAEMFGYERGAFTGALAGGKAGFIEAAGGGTLFLDEVGELAPQQQAKLLKFLEDGTIQPVGSVTPRKVDVYVVCATNRDLWRDVQEKRFREDLYYRIAMIPVEVPALRQHADDLPVLIDTLFANLNLTRARKLQPTAECRRALIAHDYPGNMRELLGVVARLDLLAGETAGIELLPPAMQRKAGGAAVDTTAAGGTLKQRVRAYERSLIAEAMRGAGSKRQAARALGIDIASLLRKLQDP